VTLQRHDERTGDVVETIEFQGAILGSASSEHETHRGHPKTTWAPRRVKCSACRWLEVTIFLSRSGDPKTDDELTYGYVVQTVGMSNVPGEVNFERLWTTSSAFEVVELLTVRRGQPNGTTETFIPPQHARALAQAATLDEDIREAYVNRAVA
jgi:hypothetical protein